MYCLDTNIIIDFIKGDKETIEKITELSKLSDLYLSIITVCEIYKGLCNEKKSEKEGGTIASLFDSLYILDLDYNAAREFKEIYAKLKNIEEVKNEFDLIIAAIVKSNDLTLITKDKKHFNNTGIKLQIW